MTVKFWEVRGSYPVPGPDTVRYGGNTSCVEVRLDDGTIIILDAGSGIRPLGLSIMEEGFDTGNGNAHILISHTHWDHIMGLPFFEPAKIAGNHITIWGRKREGYPMRDVIAGQQVYPFCPVPFEDMKATLEFQDILEGDRLSVGGATVTPVHLNHPFHDLGYRVEGDGKVLVYISDTSPYDDVLLEDEFISDPKLAVPPDGTPEQERQRAHYEAVMETLESADMAIYDTFFEPDGYEARPHWGHSTPRHAIDACKKMGVKRLALFHHAPDNTDEKMDAIEAKYRDETEGDPLEVMASKEGLSITL